ncbi:sugar transferase [Alsobacter metallidurans]|nr:sugar transferase [Alsobacter metallidurans]
MTAPICVHARAEEATAGAASYPSASALDGGSQPITMQPRRLDSADGSFAPIGGWRKRSIDIVVACTALILLLPIFMMVALAIKLTMGGPVIFSQLRIGQGRRPFRCLKFRTMVQDSDAALRQYLASDPQAAQEWREFRKLRRDPRVTRIGSILRKTSLDELPQLLNVLRGDMSCVGPRPVLEDELERYGPHARDYARVRPGLTGLWQTSGRNLRTYDERVALDCHYVQHWTLWGDVLILLKTVPAVISFGETS